MNFCLKPIRGFFLTISPAPQYFPFDPAEDSIPDQTGELVAGKQHYALLGIFTIPLFIACPVFAEMEISNLEISPVVANKFIVQYSWKVDVNCPEDKSNPCGMRIIFFDASGIELHSKSRMVSLNKGMNHLSGHGICKPEVWEKIREYKVHITCP